MSFSYSSELSFYNPFEINSPLYIYSHCVKKKKKKGINYLV